MTSTTLLALVALFEGFALLWVFLGYHRLKSHLRAGLRKAERDGCAWVRLPYNQVAQLMGWKPEFISYRHARTGEKTTFRSSVYPIKRLGGAISNRLRHPALLSPAKRGKL